MNRSLLLISILLVSLASCASPHRPATPQELDAWVAKEIGLGAPSFEELWVLARSGGAPDSYADLPAGAALVLESEAGALPLPLERTSVRANVEGRIADVEVTQRFAPVGEGQLEAVYVFRLPAGAAVTDFVLTIGARRIRGVVRERKEAERLYLAAKRQGYLSALLSEVATDTFVQRVGNLSADVPVDVRLAYFHGLPCEDGWCRLDIPAVRALTGEVSLEVDVDAGVPIEAIESPTHPAPLALQRDTPERASVRLSGTGTTSNEGFSLQWQIDGPKWRGAMFVYGEAFHMMIQPPRGSELSEEVVIDYEGTEPRGLRSSWSGSSSKGSFVTSGRLSASTRAKGPVSVTVADVPVLELTPRTSTRSKHAKMLARIEIDRLQREACMLKQESGLQAIADKMRSTALEHGIVSWMTSFVLVDTRSR